MLVRKPSDHFYIFNLPRSHMWPRSPDRPVLFFALKSTITSCVCRGLRLKPKALQSQCDRGVGGGGAHLTAFVRKKAEASELQQEAIVVKDAGRAREVGGEKREKDAQK